MAWGRMSTKTTIINDYPIYDCLKMCLRGDLKNKNSKVITRQICTWQTYYFSFFGYSKKYKCKITIQTKLPSVNKFQIPNSIFKIVHH